MVKKIDAVVEPAIKEIEDLVGECLPGTSSQKEWVFDNFNWKAFRAGLKDILLCRDAGYLDE